MRGQNATEPEQHYNNIALFEVFNLLKQCSEWLSITGWNNEVLFGAHSTGFRTKVTQYFT
jgi:hypothetical protein